MLCRGSQPSAARVSYEVNGEAQMDQQPASPAHLPARAALCGRRGSLVRWCQLGGRVQALGDDLGHLGGEVVMTQRPSDRSAVQAVGDEIVTLPLKYVDRRKLFARTHGDVDAFEARPGPGISRTKLTIKQLATRTPSKKGAASGETSRLAAESPRRSALLGTHSSAGQASMVRMGSAVESTRGLHERPASQPLFSLLLPGPARERAPRKH
jgi:hypothetical protein